MPKNFLFRILFLVVAGSMVWTAARAPQRDLAADSR